MHASRKRIYLFLNISINFKILIKRRDGKICFPTLLYPYLCSNRNYYSQPSHKHFKARRVNNAWHWREEREEGRMMQEENKERKKIELTDSLVHSGIDHGAKLGEARLPHDVGGALHPFWRWYRKRSGLGPCQDSTVPAVSVWTGAGGPLGRCPP